MVKIKREVKKNLPQLIEWEWDNDAKNKAFYSNCDGGSVYFDGDGDVYVEHEIAKTDTFTVEVEEEITEDTVLPILIERRDFGNELTYSRYEYVRIKDIKEESSTLFYIENDDKSLTLIWRNGKLVE